VIIIDKERKGISTFIATLLLMVLAVSAGVVIYAYTVGYVGGFGGPLTLGSISVDAWALTEDTATSATDYYLTAHLRNTGKTTFKIDRIYVNGLEEIRFTPIDFTLTEGGIDDLVITGGFEGSKTYEIKLIGADNTQLILQVKK
jgi:hypothetical protein